MPVINRFAGYADDMKEWRHWLHLNPELGLELPKTAAYVAARLRSFGVDELQEGIAQTGMVAIISGQGAGPTICLRADMDAPPSTEATGAAHASETPRYMHGCGQDGHTTMLLGTARHLAETRRFRGRVALIYQPTEELGGGDLLMAAAGIMKQFDISQVFALHNGPNMGGGTFAINSGPMLAGADQFKIIFEGPGGHAARPDLTRDALLVVVDTVQALQTVAARDRPGYEPFVLTVSQVRAGKEATNVFGMAPMLGGTVRAFLAEMREMAKRRVHEITVAQAAAFGFSVSITYTNDIPPTVNDPDKATFAAEVASELVGADAVDNHLIPRMGVEDFSYTVEGRPGAYMWIGQGECPAQHQPTYDFNDDIALLGAGFSLGRACAIARYLT
ncbi:amidohydrolase [uncultured Boseongicola sp.]|uniref:amidohydrolase n=1 Tax=uncultured Boseongicola sp. TaxID=1648499 RepID=UPI002639D0D3|nr:amidohydrolase [uncultured Boseongicola sp.]